MKLITTAEVAAVCGVMPKTVRRWRETGRLGPEPVTVDGRFRFDALEAELWIKQRMPRQESWREMWRVNRPGGAA